MTNHNFFFKIDNEKADLVILIGSTRLQFLSVVKIYKRDYGINLRRGKD